MHIHSDDPRGLLGMVKGVHEYQMSVKGVDECEMLRAYFMESIATK